MSGQLEWDDDLEALDEDEWYIRMLDAVGEYMDSIAERDNTDITQRDITIIRALIDFYGFEEEDMTEVLDDVVSRSEQLELEEKQKNH